MGWQIANSTSFAKFRINIELLFTLQNKVATGNVSFSRASLGIRSTNYSIDLMFMHLVEMGIKSHEGKLFNSQEKSYTDCLQSSHRTISYPPHVSLDLIIIEMH